MKTIMLSFGLSSWQRPIFLLLSSFFLSFSLSSLSLFLGLFGAIGAQTLRARTVPAGANEGLLQARCVTGATRARQAALEACEIALKSWRVRTPLIGCA